MPRYVQTLDTKKLGRETVESIKDLEDAINRLEARCAALEQQLAAQPPVLTLQEINAGLSADGEAPLNLTGLVGSPVTS